MANPTCTEDSLVESNPCLSGNVFSPRDQMFVQVWFNILELQALGGTDYRSVVASTLIADANCLADNFDLSQYRTATLAVHRNNAVNAGATVPTDPNVLKDAIKCFEDYPDPKNLILLLLCKLGSHKSFPQ